MTLTAPTYRGPDRRLDDDFRQIVSKMTRAELERELFTDDLTLIVGNRRALAVETECRQIAAYLAVDVDGLKWVNDYCGHDAGDLLLCEVAHRLKECFSDVDHGFHVFRTGGDEFVVTATFDVFPTIGKLLKRAVVTLRTSLFQWTDGSGCDWSGRGASFSWGIGTTLPEADEALLGNKMRRLKRRDRSRRGEKPMGFVVTNITGQGEGVASGVIGQDLT